MRFRRAPAAKILGPRHENERFSIVLGRLCIVYAHGIMPHVVRGLCCPAVAPSGPNKRPRRHRRFGGRCRFRRTGVSSPFGGFTVVHTRSRSPGSPQRRKIDPPAAHAPACGRAPPHNLWRRLIPPGKQLDDDERAAAEILALGGQKGAFLKAHRPLLRAT